MCDLNGVLLIGMQLNGTLLLGMQFLGVQFDETLLIGVLLLDSGLAMKWMCFMSSWFPQNPPRIPTRVRIESPAAAKSAGARPKVVR